MKFIKNKVFFTKYKNTERIACINFQELGAFKANIRINAIYNKCNICKCNYYTYILLKRHQTLSYLRLKL